MEVPELFRVSSILLVHKHKDILTNENADSDSQIRFDLFNFFDLIFINLLFENQTI